MSDFDPESFLDASTTEALVKRPPLPAGQDFVGTITSLKMREWQGKKDPTQSGIACDVVVEINLDEYPSAKDALGGISKVTLQDGLMLDTLANKKDLDYGPGKNGKLRRYRESTDLNTAGQKFSLRDFTGKRIKVKIKHDLYEGELYDKIDSVSHP